MPKLRAETTKDIIAILCSDLHFSDRPPIARSGENWYECMRRYLKQLTDLQIKHANAAIVVAGDLLDSWRECPALINFLLVHMPTMYAVPGNHDCKHGNINDLDKTAYWTLVEAGKIKHLDPYVGVGNIDGPKGLVIVGFPWGYPLQAAIREEKEHGDIVYLAVVHDYIWSKAAGHHPKAKESQYWKAQRAKLKNFDVALFGDNHTGFKIESKTKGMPHIFNAGTFFRRKIDEISYKPHVGLLHADGTVSRHYLDTSEDVFLDTRKADELTGMDISKLIEEFERIGGEIVSYGESLMQFLSANNIDNTVARIIRKVIEQQRSGK